MAFKFVSFTFDHLHLHKALELKMSKLSTLHLDYIDSSARMSCIVTPKVKCMQHTPEERLYNDLLTQFMNLSNDYFELRKQVNNLVNCFWAFLSVFIFVLVLFVWTPS